MESVLTTLPLRIKTRLPTKEAQQELQRTQLASWLMGQLVCTQLSVTVQDHLPRDGAAHSGLGLSTSINNQNKPPTLALLPIQYRQFLS